MARIGTHLDLARKAQTVIVAWKYDPAVRLRIRALGFVVLLHAFIIHGLAASLSHVRIDLAPSYLQVTLIKDLAFLDDAPPPEAPPTFEIPPVLIPPPEVLVRLQTGPNAIEGEIALPILGPRMDPNRPNPFPPLPSKLKGVVPADAIVVLRIQVLKDGGIGDVEIAQRSGAGTLDVLAMYYAKAHWRYLPAMRNGRLIEDRRGLVPIGIVRSSIDPIRDVTSPLLKGPRTFIGRVGTCQLYRIPHSVRCVEGFSSPPAI